MIRLMPESREHGRELVHDGEKCEMRIEELVFISIGFLQLFIPLLVVVVIVRRIIRGEGLFTDRDWVFLFGKPKEEVLTETFWSKVGAAGIICLAVAFIEYYVLAPIGTLWFVAAILLRLGCCAKSIAGSFDASIKFRPDIIDKASSASEAQPRRWADRWLFREISGSW